MGDIALDADRPIKTGSQDRLGRGPLVEHLAAWVDSAPSDEGFVVGLTGTWGLGKTSVLNLLASRLDKEIRVVRFEPWLFSSADQLVVRYFEEISGQIAGSKKKRARKAAKKLAEYGDALSPAASLVVGPAGNLLSLPKAVVDGNADSAIQQRDELREALVKAGQKIAVFVDDIDRLTPQEVREVFRLVKLVGDLPGIVHVLAYDRHRINRSLNQDQIDDGTSFLEKIVQVSMAVPQIPPSTLVNVSMGWLDDALGQREMVAWDPEEWQKILDGGITGFLETLRDGRRLANSAPTAIDLCGDEVASMDVLALEALRVFDPEVHERLPLVAEALLGSTEFYDFRDQDTKDEDHAKLIEELLSQSRRPEPSKKLLATLFPLAAHLLGGSRTEQDSGWRKRKRVASRSIFHRYIHLALPTAEVESRIVDRALACLSQADSFAAILDEVEGGKKVDFLNQVRGRLDEQTGIDVAGVSLALIERIDSIPSGDGFFGVEPQRHVRWLIEELVETLHDCESKADVVKRCVLSAPSLSTSVELHFRWRLPKSGPSDSPKTDFLKGDDLAEVVASLANRVQQTTADDLSQERNVFWLLSLVGEAKGQADVLALLQNEAVLIATLNSHGTSVRPFSDGVSVDVAPLLELAGPQVEALLVDLSERDDMLEPEVLEALRRSLGRLQQERDTEQA